MSTSKNTTRRSRNSIANTKPKTVRSEVKTPRSAVASPSSKAKETTVLEAVSKSGIEPLRKKELIDTVVRRSGIKKKDAKPVIEALLAELGENLAAGRELALPPLGRVKINREKDIPNGRVIVMKLRRQTKSDAGQPPVAAE